MKTDLVFPYHISFRADLLASDEKTCSFTQAGEVNNNSHNICEQKKVIYKTSCRQIQ